MPITSTSSYRPNGGGDFSEVLELPDGSVRAVIGDVMGHGPDEAELGERLRKVWRSGVTGQVPDGQLLWLMHAAVAESARTAGPLGRFATACDVTLTAAAHGGAQVTVRSAGHPAQLIWDGRTSWYSDLRVGPPLGVPSVVGEELWQPVTVDLPPNSRLVLYTDGLLDGYATSESLGLDELLSGVTACPPDDSEPGSWLTRLLDSAPREPSDDTAVVVLAIP